VPVHRQPLDPRPGGDRAHGGADRTNLAVKAKGGVDNATASQGLSLGSLPELVTARRPHLHWLIVAVQWNADAAVLHGRAG
jgi:hypothetical protein